MMRWLALILIAGLSLPLTTKADERPVERYADALAYIWETHPDILRARNEVSATDYALTGAYAGFMPFVQLDATVGRNSDDSIARYVLPVFSGGATLAEVDGAEAGIRAARAEIGRVQVSLGLRLSDAWFNWVSALDQDVLWLGYIEKLKGLSRVIQRRSDEGASPQADVVNILTRLRQAEAQAQRNRAQIYTARAQVQSLVGVRALATPVWPDEGRKLSPGELDAAWARAEKEHPLLVFNVATIARQDAERRVNRGRIIPEVQVRYNEPLGDRRSQNSSTESVELFVQYRSDTGLRSFQAMRSSAARTDGARASLSSARRELKSDIDATRADLESFKLQLSYQEAGAKAADELVESFLRQYDVGRKTWVEVLNALREANDTQLQLVQQRRGLWASNQRLAIQGLYWEKLLRESDTDTISLKH